MKSNKYCTSHARKRLQQRGKPTPVSDKTISIIALRKGKRWKDVPPGALREYLIKKTQVDNKRVRLYKNYVFIYFRNSNRLITCYHLPKKFIKNKKDC